MVNLMALENIASFFFFFLFLLHSMWGDQYSLHITHPFFYGTFKNAGWQFKSLCNEAAFSDTHDAFTVRRYKTQELHLHNTNALKYLGLYRVWCYINFSYIDIRFALNSSITALRTLPWVAGTHCRDLILVQCPRGCWAGLSTHLWGINANGKFANAISLC